MDERRETKQIRLERTGNSRLPLGNIAWEAELNGQQLDAVQAPDGPVLVLAGAGSGKTRVITYRVAYLINDRRVQPHNIMLATFTNKAARSMLARCEEVIGPAARDVTGGTFHHIANLLLRKYAKALGYENSFTILDESDARSVMKVCRTESGVDTKERAFPSDRLLTNMASTLINTNTDLGSLLSDRYPHLYDRFDDIQRVLILYHEKKRLSNQMDFDDLLVNLLKLLTEHPDIRRKLAGRYQHVLVDEYQDVNHVQAAIVRELFLGEQPDATGPQPGHGGDDDDLAPPLPAGGTDAAPQTGDEINKLLRRGLFVVGDDAQSIYSFRGADYRNIRQFPETFPGAHVFKLEVNYRSVPQVLTLANGILNDSDPMFQKTLRPVKPDGEDRPLLLATRDADEQAEFVAEQILHLREEAGIEYSEMAVLYRTHANRLEVELEFTKRGITFVVRGGLRFFEQAHIKDLLSYLVVLNNRRDELAWQRMLEMCNRVGPKTVSNILTKIRNVDDAEGGPLGKFINNGVAESARGQAKSSLTELRDFLKELEPKLESLPVSELLGRILEGRYKAYLEVKHENWRQRLEDLEQLIVYASRFDSLPAFLAEVGLHGGFSGKDIVNMGVQDDAEGGEVTLSTIHQAKGLEWQVVFLVHVQDDVIPHRMSQGNPDQEDEEQRLLYVAVTRAKELLFMSYPQLTQTRDYQRIINHPSRFLEGLPGECFDQGALEFD